MNAPPQLYNAFRNIILQVNHTFVHCILFSTVSHICGYIHEYNLPSISGSFVCVCISGSSSDLPSVTSINKAKSDALCQKSLQVTQITIQTSIHIFTSEAHHYVRNVMYVFTYQYLHSFLVVLEKGKKKTV